MKILDAASMIENVESLLQEVKRQQDQLSPVESWLHNEAALLGVESRFNGRTAIRIINYFTYCHGPFVKLLRTIMSEFEASLKDTLNQLNTYFNQNEFIREDFLQNEVNGKIEELKSTMTTLGEEVNSIIAMYKDVVYLPEFNYNRVIDGLAASKSKSEETVEKVYQYDYEQLPSMEFVGQDIQLLQNYVSSLEEMFASQSISIEQFNHNMIKDNEEFRAVKSTQNVREADQLFSVLGDTGTYLGYGDSAFFAGQNMLAATSIGIGTYADMVKKGKTPLPKSTTTSTPQKPTGNSIFEKGKYTVSKVKIHAGVALHNALRSEPAQNFARTFSKFEIEKYAAKFVDNKLTRAAGPVGWGLTIAGNFSEFTDQANREKSGISKFSRFASGIAVEGGSAAGGAFVGAKAGAAIGTFIAPGVGTVVGGLIGGAVGGVSGAIAGGKVSDKVKDVAEAGVNKALSVGKSVVSWFK
ncbi:LXG domain-containing protein [Alkalihalophilus pseudofirmus]|uniref:LXG domain-containing protein n=1 Tax=Alkalihalophilus pseudofirmus TaxID=79885 RepID=A0AAJ2KTU5_ALKPS|nr:LXG domain-containing protein [Alkalihalophilus pseudofirmus]MDV2883748.1 LXG domain-containing protein [Alkalihalophilus pseudofirmus]